MTIFQESRRLPAYRLCVPAVDIKPHTIMSTFSFQASNADQAKAYLDNAANTASAFSTSSTAFPDGAVFHIVGFTTGKTAVDGVVSDKAREKAVFLTQEGQNIEVPSLFKTHVGIDPDGKRVVMHLTGTFVAKVKEIVAANASATPRTILQAIQAAAPNGVRIVRRSIIMKAKDGHEFPATFTDYDLA